MRDLNITLIALLTILRRFEGIFENNDHRYYFIPQ